MIRLILTTSCRVFNRYICYPCFIHSLTRKKRKKCKNQLTLKDAEGRVQLLSSEVYSMNNLERSQGKNEYIKNLFALAFIVDGRRSTIFESSVFKFFG